MSRKNMEKIVERFVERQVPKKGGVRSIGTVTGTISPKMG
jgi:hypothetical protein